MQIQYFGWSGVTLHHADTLVGFDLFGDAVTWDGIEAASTTILCLTHGHPEHCGSLRDLLAADGAGARLSTTHLVSSPAVVQHVAGSGALPPGHAHGLADRESRSIAGARVTTFAWRHMPLLPPGLGPRMDYMARLLSRPLELARIGLSGLRLPLNAPMLGFHVTFADGTTALNYAEGLHRLTDRREVEAIARDLPAETLLFAVEPDDVDAIPRWLEVLRPANVYLYEAHRPWRELFRLPYVDLNAYAGELSARFPETRFHALTRPGQKSEPLKV